MKVLPFPGFHLSQFVPWGEGYVTPIDWDMGCAIF